MAIIDWIDENINIDEKNKHLGIIFPGTVLNVFWKLMIDNKPDLSFFSVFCIRSYLSIWYLPGMKPLWSCVSIIQSYIYSLSNTTRTYFISNA